MTALIFTAGITLSIGQGVRILIDRGFTAGSMAQLNQAVLFILVLAVLMAVGTFIRFYQVSWLGERVSADIRSAVFEHIVMLHPNYFESNRSGEIMSRLTTDTTLLQSIIGSSLSMALRSFLTMSGALVMLFVTNLKLTFIVLACVPLVLIPILIYGRKVRALSRKSQDSIAEVGSYAGEIIQQIKTVQSYTHEEQEKKAFNREVEKSFSVAKQRIQQRAVLTAAIILLVFGALSAMVWVGGKDVLTGVMSGGELGAFIFYALMVAMGVGTISEVYGELQRAAGATERLMELLDAENLIVKPDDELTDAGLLEPELQFNRINFCYPSRPDQPALKHFDLSVPAGKVLALVGPSGAGKSTIFEMIQRFYDPQTGVITFGGEDIRKLDPRDLRQQLAVVSQHPTLFSTDVASNIAYGSNSATKTEVIAAAKAAFAHEFIEALPEGYNSYLGEQGVRLSGGQKQRIAIARAILKNPRVLMLDEATSALDTESEHKVQQALEGLMNGRTTVIIAHRLSTILHADQIVVVNEGEVVGLGTHKQLLESSELYAKLARLQFRDEA